MSESVIENMGFYVLTCFCGAYCLLNELNFASGFMQMKARPFTSKQLVGRAGPKIQRSKD